MYVKTLPNSTENKMANSLIVDGPRGLVIPQDVTDFFNEVGSNIEERVMTPTLSYEGKTWTINADGQKNRLMKRNADGDEEPLSVMRVIILDYAKRRGRAYYEGNYDPSRISGPVCWSDDGIAPPDEVPQKQHPKCEGCPKSIKGSKVTDNDKLVVACSQHRMLAVVPANRLDFTPLRLKLAITSDYDGKVGDHEASGWFAFGNFLKWIQSKGITHTAAMVVKMKFDPSVTYPKVLFAVDRWLEKEQRAQIKPVVLGDVVKALISGNRTPAVADKLIHATALPAPVARPAPADDEEEEEVMLAPAKPTPAPAPEKPIKAAKVVKKVDTDEGTRRTAKDAQAAKVVQIDDEEVEIIPPTKHDGAGVTHIAAPEISDDLSALLDQWGPD